MLRQYTRLYQEVPNKLIFYLIYRVETYISILIWGAFKISFHDGQIIGWKFVTNFVIKASLSEITIIIFHVITYQFKSITQKLESGDMVI